MLLVFGTEPTVEGTSLVDRGAEGFRQAGRLAMFVPIVIGHVRAYEILLEAMLRTMLAEVDTPLADDDLGIDKSAAVGAQTAGRAEEGVIAEVHRNPFLWTSKLKQFYALTRASAAHIIQWVFVEVKITAQVAKKKTVAAPMSAKMIRIASPIAFNTSFMITPASPA
jgi:hypothetical protein